jgi:queuine tRNA-ribosyltransferase
MSFEIIYKDKNTKARVGRIKTSHGFIDTPFYMPVATKGSIKYLSPNEASEIGYRCIISNALVNYFVYGTEVFKKTKGIHNLINWKHSLTTDSGGFQLLSDSFLIKTNKEGAIFKNPFNGKKELITPEKLIKIQEIIGSDIAMMLDDVVRFGKSHKEYFNAMVNTHEWARRQIKAKKRKEQLLFGIAQGGFYKDLREHSAKYISSLPFDGFALGGLAIGEPFETFIDMVSFTINFLPEDKPRYLLGVGNPTDIIKSIEFGCDMFDSTFPTRNARHGTLFTWNGLLRITNAKYKYDLEPIEKTCNCYTCKNFSRSFIHHGIKNKEPNVLRYVTIHNLYFMQNMIEKARESIKNGNYKEFSKNFIDIYKKNKN